MVMNRKITIYGTVLQKNNSQYHILCCADCHESGFRATCVCPYYDLRLWFAGHDILQPDAAPHHKISDNHFDQFRELHKEKD